MRKMAASFKIILIVVLEKKEFSNLFKEKLLSTEIYTEIHAIN